MIIDKIPQTISYSALTDWNRCTWYYYLKDVLRLPAFTSSVDTFLGSVLHDRVQNLLAKKQTKEECIKYFQRTWKTFCKLYRKSIDKETEEKYRLSGEKIINNIEECFQKEFGEYEVLAVEDEINEEIENYPQKFKGYVDLIIAIKNGPIIVVDFKKTSTAFWFMRYKDKYKDYQLTLYKKFLSKKLSIPEDQIKSYFCLMETTFSQKSSQVSLVYISSKKVKVENATKWLNEALDSVNNKRYIKNRTACKMYGKDCPFFNTSHCSK